MAKPVQTFRLRLAVLKVLVVATALTLALGSTPGSAQSRAPHVYLFRGLADVYSLGMNTLAGELNARGVNATAHSHTDWQPIADRAAAAYKAGKEGPIILVGHSLGADAVMEMADYLGDKGVPVALVVPFDGTQSFPVPGNVGRVINFTQRDYAYMRPGPGFHGSLSNVDLSADRTISHTTIDKSPQLHARVINEVLAIVGGRGVAAPAAAKPAPIGEPAVRATETAKPAPDGGTPIIALPEPRGAPASAATPPPSPPPQKPVAVPSPVDPTQIPD
jgi:thioesterase domain-containing protein